MRRRRFITLLGATAFTWPLEARAQQPAMPVVGLRSSGIADAYQNEVAAFREGLKQTGYIENQNVVIKKVWANNEVERLPALTADLVNRQVAVIFAMGPPAGLAAKAATSTIPVVVAIGGVVRFQHAPGLLCSGGVTHEQDREQRQHRRQRAKALVHDGSSLALLAQLLGSGRESSTGPTPLICDGRAVGPALGRSYDVRR